jgi:antitoxin HicB
LALYQAMREDGLNNVTLARKLGLVEGEVRRMLDLDHQTRIGTLEKALWQLGKQMASEVRRAA